MRGQIPRLISEANTNVSADLSDPYPSPLKCVRRQPKSRVNAFIYRGPSLLYDDVFLTTKYVERTYRGGQKLVPKDESASGLDCTCHIELPREMPATGDKRNDRILHAFHNNEIERITVSGAIGVACAAGLLSKSRSH